MTEPINVRPETEPAFIRLSIFLAGCRTTELLHVINDYDQGLLTVLESVPIDGETFTVSMTQLNGKVIKRTLVEEVIRDTADARQWRAEKADSSRLAIMASTGEISMTLETLARDPNEFTKLVASRRAFLKGNRSKVKSAAQPKKPAKAAAHAPCDTRSGGKSSGSEAQVIEYQFKDAQKPTSTAGTTEG